MRGIKLIMHWLIAALLLSECFVSLAASADAPKPAPASVEAAQPSLPPSNDKINQIIQTLQDPQAREQLIEQLRILSQAQQTLPAQPVSSPKPVKSQVSFTLISISKSINELHFGATQLAAAF